jgi:metal-responsive CopG/Arc/MetJ family transcriptional regulator
MKVIEVQIEESLLEEVDQATRSLAMTREDFVRAAVERALRQQEIIALEQRHARGYADRPQSADEVGEWETEQVWGEP